jgi:hypothetical protein
MNEEALFSYNNINTTLLTLHSQFSCQLCKSVPINHPGSSIRTTCCQECIDVQRCGRLDSGKSFLGATSTSSGFDDGAFPLFDTLVKVALKAIGILEALLLVELIDLA